MPRTYADALARLAQLQSNRHITTLFDKRPPPASPGKDLNAAAIPEMLAWLRRAGYSPQDLARMRHIHVAGTKGKGSVCAHATALLRRHGRRVGTYTSPHLVSPRERIAIDGRPVGQEVFADAFFELWERFGEAARREGVEGDVDGPGTKPFYFRFLTILAWHIFSREGVDSVVLECGIGGEYDATNVLPPEAVSAAVISQLGIDHVAMLGDTVEKIAWHKAGILKPGVRGFTRRLDGQPGVMDVLRARAIEKGAELVEVEDGAVEKWGGVEGGLKGEFQKYNQALAVMAVREHLGLEKVLDKPLENLPREMVEGLQQARLRGRCEVVEDGDATWLLDGAHTTDSLEQVAKWSGTQVKDNESLILVFNQQERDASKLLTGFLDAVQRQTPGNGILTHALFTRNEQEQAVEGETRDLSVQTQGVATITGILPACETAVFDNIKSTVAEARRLASLGEGKHKILVTGSLHLVGGILRALEPQSLL